MASTAVPANLRLESTGIPDEMIVPQQEVPAQLPAQLNRVSRTES